MLFWIITSSAIAAIILSAAVYDRTRRVRIDRRSSPAFQEDRTRASAAAYLNRIRQPRA